MIAPSARILWLPGEERSWDDDGGSRSPAGVRINADNATAVAAVFACVRILSETVASLPLHVLERLPNGGKRQARELPLYRRLHERPNSWQTSFEWREQIVRHVALWGDSESEIRPGESGYADQIIPLHPSRMKIETIENDRLRYTYREAKGRQTVYSQDQILHVRGPSDDGVHGQSIAEECRDAIALARACEIHGARFFGGGARPGFILSTDNPLNADARRELADNWNRKHRGPGNAFETAVLTGGLKPYEIPYASNSDSQFLELRKYQLAEIARLFRIPMHLLQEGGASGSVEHAGIDFVQHTIVPWLRRLESAFSRDLLPDDEARDRYQISFDVRGLLRGDAASRSSYYRSMWDIGVLSTNDILALEDMNPVDGGDERYRPLNMGTLGAAPSAADVLAQQQPGSGIDGQAVEGGLAAADSATIEAPAPQVADVSLNGAQITGLIAILTQVPAGLITKDAAAALIAASFPSINSQQITAILAGVNETPAPAAPQPTATPSMPPQRSIEMRAMTISIDFDRTFAADPTLWGEFARKSVSEGNTVVMISRRPESDRQAIMGTIGDYADAFSQVLLIGGDTLKADAADAAGINVDVWVDDSPQTIRSEQRAAREALSEGMWVTLPDGRVGRVDHVMTEGVLDLGDIEMPATPDDPAALVSVWDDGEFDDPVAMKVADLQAADEPDAARGYKPKKPRRRKRG